MSWCRVGGLVLLLLWCGGCTAVQPAGTSRFAPPRDPYGVGFPGRSPEAEVENPTPSLFRFDTDIGSAR
jgi:hypothetical protein